MIFNKSFIHKYAAVSWSVKQFIFGILFGVLISISINFSMYYNLKKLSAALINIEYLKDDYLISPDYVNCFNAHKSSMSSNKCNYGKKGPRILCTVFTHEANFELKARSVAKTWGKRCDKTIFMSGMPKNKETMKNNFDLDIVYLNTTDIDRTHLTEKTIETLLYASRNSIDEFDWVLKADDDTYVIVENLKYFLANKCADDRHFYGFRFHARPPERFTNEFASGGAGYVLSRDTVKRFAHRYSSDSNFCRNNSGYEDVDIALCLDRIGVYPGESRDRLGRERFHPLNYTSMWDVPKHKKWAYNYSKFPLKKKQDCCSDSTITFHYTSGEKALQLDYLLYGIRLKPFAPNHNDYYQS